MVAARAAGDTGRLGRAHRCVSRADIVVDECELEESHRGGDYRLRVDWCVVRAGVPPCRQDADAEAGFPDGHNSLREAFALPKPNGKKKADSAAYDVDEDEDEEEDEEYEDDEEYDDDEELEDGEEYDEDEDETTKKRKKPLRSFRLERLFRTFRLPHTSGSYCLLATRCTYVHRCRIFRCLIRRRNRFRMIRIERICSRIRWRRSGLGRRCSISSGGLRLRGMN